MSYTDIAKPINPSYTDIAKPSRGFNILAGMATGLIAPPTYNARTIGTPYTTLSKPNSQSYTNIAKPI